MVRASSITACEVSLVAGDSIGGDGLRFVALNSMRMRMWPRWETTTCSTNPGASCMERILKRRPKSGWVGSMISTSSGGVSGS